MEKTLKPILLLFLFLIVSTGMKAQSEITEEALQKADSLLIEKYNREQLRVQRLQKEHPEWKDSLRAVSRQLQKNFMDEIIDTALQYANTPGGLKQVYRSRDRIEKDTLLRVLAGLPTSLQESTYARWIRQYVKTEQLEEGDCYVTFDCRTADGLPFNWEQYRGRNLLLLYDGLGCMGKDGRDYLENLLKKTRREDFDVVVYCTAENPEQFKERQDVYPQFKMISDFKPEGSVMNILYGAQGTPTCFLIGRDGIIKVISSGLDAGRFDNYLKEDNCF